MPPAWRPGGRYDRGAGLQRNTALAEAAAALIAIYDGASTGAADMIAKANRRGLAVCAVLADPATGTVQAVRHTPATQAASPA